MDHAVGGIFEIVLAAARPQVAVSVPVRLQVSVGCRAQGEAANVELSVLVKKRLFDVLLDDVAAPMPIDLLSLNETLDVVEVAADLDTTPSIRVLTWLDDPEPAAVLGVLLQHFVVLRVVECLLELVELSITLTLFDVVGEWERVERVLPHRLVIDLHIVVDGLFVTQVEVVFLMVRCDHVMAGLVLLLLLLFIIIVFAFDAASVLCSDLLQGLVATRGNARVRLLKGRQSLLL